MPGQVFLSYGRTDRGAAFRVAQRLDAEGFSVWWDPKIAPGVTYDRVIERALAGADCVVTLWSAHAVESDWVRAESDEGRRRGILVPVLIEDVQPPLQFRLIETIDLTGWLDDGGTDGFDRLRDAVARHAPPLEPMARWREALVGEPAMDRRRSDARGSWVSAARFSSAGSAVVTAGDGSLSRYGVPTLEEVASVEAHDGAIWSCRGGTARHRHRRYGRHRPGVGSGHPSASARPRGAPGLGARLRALDRWNDVGLGRPGRFGVRVGPRLRRTAQHAVADIGARSGRPTLVEDSRRFVTSSDDQTLRVWSLSDGRCLCVLRGHTAPVMACALVPDGERVLSGGYDTTVRIWDLRSAKEIDRLEGSPEWILSLAVDPGRDARHRRAPAAASSSCGT